MIQKQNLKKQKIKKLGNMFAVRNLRSLLYSQKHCGTCSHINTTSKTNISTKIN